MDVVFYLLSGVGGLVMFLYGMDVMSGALKRLGGGKFERILEKLTSNPIKGVLLGALVTAFIQSSSATTVMVIGFVNSGIMQLSQAVGVIMGANIGTTITSWIISLSGINGSNFWLNMAKPENFTPILALIGIILMMGSKSDKKKSIGNILVGFAVLMFGMNRMITAFQSIPGLSNMLTMFSNPVLGVVSGALLTAIMQSSSASVGILQALCMTGGITYASAIPIIMGQNIGACAPTLISCIGAGKNAKRAAMVHLYFNVLGTVLFLVLFYGANAILHFSFITEQVEPYNIAVIHSMFNIFSTVVLLPFNKVLVKLSKLTIREGATIDAFAKLDERFLNTPTIAVNQCMTLAVNMGYIAKEAYELAVSSMLDYTEEKSEKIIENEKIADKYMDALGSYLVRLSARDLPEDDSRRVSMLFSIIGDFEQITDYSVNVLYTARVKNEKGIRFSDKAVNEMTVMSNAVDELFDKLMDAFSASDSQTASTVIPLGAVVESLKDYLKERHIRRVRKGKCSVDAGFEFTDYVTGLEKISGHCVNIACAMMECSENNFDLHHFMGEFRGTDEYKESYLKYSEKYALPIMTKSYPI